MIATTLLVMSTVAAAATVVVLRRRAEASEGPQLTGAEPMAMAAAKKPASRTPTRTVNPKLFGKESGMWELRASAKCEFAKSLDGKRYEAADSIALPLPGCNPMTCDCHYVAVRDNRGNPRRKGDERREALRFDPAKKERRAKDRRRRSVWDGTR